MANVTSSQSRAARMRSAQANGRGGATATGTGARPANQPRGGAPVTQGQGGTPTRGRAPVTQGRGGIPSRQSMSIGGLGGRLGAAVAGLQAYNTGDGTRTAAAARGDLSKRRQPTTQEKAQYARDEAKARAANAERQKKYNSTGKGFDDAFASARKAGVNEFTWNGKRYNTKVK